LVRDDAFKASKERFFLLLIAFDILALIVWQFLNR